MIFSPWVAQVFNTTHMTYLELFDNYVVFREV